MAIDVLEKADQPSSSTTDVEPPRPESFVEAARLQAAVQEELEAILASPSFKGSRKSSEFLRYVVQVALDGRIDSLKERSIGLDLLGRDISYDPSSDATVRVRANEVRRRLKSFYSSQPSQSGYRIELLPGSYGPRFVRDPVASASLNSAVMSPPLQLGGRQEADRSAVEQAGRLHDEWQAVPPINLVGIMRPAFIALFICALFLRQQIQDGDPYHQFWDTRLQGKTAMILAGADNANAGLDRIPGREDGISAMLPLVWLAGRYDLRPVTGSRKDESEDMQAETEDEPVIVHSALSTPAEFNSDKRIRYLVSNLPGANGIPIGIIDRSGEAHQSSPGGHAAVLTLLPEHPGTLWIAGTDWETVRRLAEMISSKSSFPSRLSTESQTGRVLQAVLRGTFSTQLEFYSEQR